MLSYSNNYYLIVFFPNLYFHKINNISTLNFNYILEKEKYIKDKLKKIWK